MLFLYWGLQTKLYYLSHYKLAQWTGEYDYRPSWAISKAIRSSNRISHCRGGGRHTLICVELSLGHLDWAKLFWWCQVERVVVGEESWLCDAIWKAPEIHSMETLPSVFNEMYLLIPVFPLGHPYSKALGYKTLRIGLILGTIYQPTHAQWLKPCFWPTRGFWDSFLHTDLWSH